MMNGNNSPISAYKIIDVAIVVLRYADRFLLAKRHHHQHQGDKLEFIGGKVDADECKKAAARREVFEELGLSLLHEQLNLLGVIEHDYDDRSVRLHVYQAFLTMSQHDFYGRQTIGKEGQKLHWLNLSQLQQHLNELPKANEQIVHWLSLPSCVIITHSLSEFTDCQAFVSFYADKLPKNGCCYLRIKDKNAAKIFQDLSVRRQDVKWIVPYKMLENLSSDFNVWAIKLDDADVCDIINMDNYAELLKFNTPFLLGVHNENQAKTANILCQNLPILAAFISPVYATQSHPQMPALGWQGFSKLNNELKIPSIALGGLSANDLPMAQEFGALAVSGIRGFVI